MTLPDCKDPNCGHPASAHAHFGECEELDRVQDMRQGGVPRPCRCAGYTDTAPSVTDGSTPRSERAQLVHDLREFSAESEADCYTDTERAWRLLERCHAMLSTLREDGE